ncbi:hypothetical protein ACYPKM_02025 [Pseudomonas aeruginosa]
MTTAAIAHAQEWEAIQTDFDRLAREGFPKRSLLKAALLELHPNVTDNEFAELFDDAVDEGRILVKPKVHVPIEIALEVARQFKHGRPSSRGEFIKMLQITFPDKSEEMIKVYIEDMERRVKENG